MKKILLGVLIGVLILGTGFGVYYVLENNKGNNSNNNNVNNNDNNNGNNGSDKTVDNNNTNTNNNNNSNSNCNTECDCEDKVAKKIDSLVSKYNLTKIERYSAYLNYSYPKDNDSRIRYQFTLTIEDGKLALLRGTSIVADNAVHSAPKLLTSPCPSSSFLNIYLSALGKCTICNSLNRKVR